MHKRILCRRATGVGTALWVHRVEMKDVLQVQTIVNVVGPRARTGTAWLARVVFSLILGLNLRFKGTPVCTGQRF